MAAIDNESYAALERALIGDIWTSDEAYRTLRELCDDIGHRYGGSESEKQGAEFLRRRMTAYQLQNVRVEEFPMAGWERGAAELRMVAPVEREFSCIAMPYCPAADLTAELLDAGDGEEEDFERLGDQVRGKIVISAAEKTRKGGARSSHRNDKYGWAVERGAAAHIFINQNPGMLHITGSITGRNPGGSTAADREAPIPGVGVSWEHGSAILRLAERSDAPARMHLKLTNRTFESTSQNVIGEIVGSEKPDEVILMGGHYDGHDISQAAGDDGAGAVVGLEAARALAAFKGQLKRTVRVICFGYEELGLGGSWTHAERYDASDNGEQLRLALNLDGAGRGAGGQEQINVTADAALQTWFAGLAETLHYDFETRNRLSAHSDHYPFFLAGYPSATLNSRDSTAGMIGRGYGHTEGDTVDKVTLRGLQMGAAFATRVAIELANAEPFPAQRRDQNAVRAELERANMTNFLEHHWGRDNRAV
jgi:aminopeptidase YwaD